MTNTAYATACRFPARSGDRFRDSPAERQRSPLAPESPAGLGWAIGSPLSPRPARGPDQDGANNILHNGMDVANQDGGDDGWLNPEVSFDDCQESALRVRVAKLPNTQPDQMLDLHVWYDGNRDGDSADAHACVSPACRGMPPPLSGSWRISRLILT